MSQSIHVAIGTRLCALGAVIWHHPRHLAIGWIRLNHLLFGSGPPCGPPSLGCLSLVSSSPRGRTFLAMASETIDPCMALLPDTALAFALGVRVASPQSVSNVGQVSTLTAELQRRGVYDDMLAVLDPELAARIELLDSADRGQRWARTGRR
ncbi:hypothetical protein PROPHIT491_48 [Mycobacterium phage prophiT49-1]|nr:hypothetical protein PROPHIT491_48 [Mycobacterium phage prophiT49-1]